jgi:hypothetical protein
LPTERIGILFAGHESRHAADNRKGLPTIQTAQGTGFDFGARLLRRQRKVAAALRTDKVFCRVRLHRRKVDSDSKLPSIPIHYSS